MDYTQLLQEKAQELARWTGVGLRPLPGCRIAKMILGDAYAMVEYEYERAEPDRPNPDLPSPGPGHPANVILCRVLINGCMCDVEDVIPEHVQERWVQQLLEAEE
jgi:hypothetical protein